MQLGKQNSVLCLLINIRLSHIINRILIINLELHRVDYTVQIENGQFKKNVAEHFARFIIKSNKTQKL